MNELFGAPGEPCGSCGAPLAADQRYCLACGTRRSDARLPFREILTRQAQTETQLVPVGAAVPAMSGYGVVPPHEGMTVNDRLRRNAPLMALVGILLLAMLIGVLLGHWAHGSSTVASAAPARPQIIQVGGAAAAPVAAAPAATTTTAADTPAASSSDTSTTAADTSGSSPPAGAGATNNAVKNLSKVSGKDYQKQIDKLGKTISTGGKAPPKDHKAPAGGGSFEDIG